MRGDLRALAAEEVDRTIRSGPRSFWSCAVHLVGQRGHVPGAGLAPGKSRWGVGPRVAEDGARPTSPPRSSKLALTTTGTVPWRRSPHTSAAYWKMKDAARPAWSRMPPTGAAGVGSLKPFARPVGALDGDGHGEHADGRKVQASARSPGQPRRRARARIYTDRTFSWCRATMADVPQLADSRVSQGAGGAPSPARSAQLGCEKILDALPRIR